MGELRTLMAILDMHDKGIGYQQPAIALSTVRLDFWRLQFMGIQTAADIDILKGGMNHFLVLLCLEA